MNKLTHLDSAGNARMVDVGSKAETHRVAIAKGLIWMNAATLAAIAAGNAPKGDVLGTARIAGMGRAAVVPYFPRRVGSRYIISFMPALDPW